MLRATTVLLAAALATCVFAARGGTAPETIVVKRWPRDTHAGYADYRRAAASSAFRRAVRSFAAECGCREARVVGLPGARGFIVANTRADSLLYGWTRRYRPRGAYVFREYDSATFGDRLDHLIVLPTHDQFEVVRAVATAAPTFDLLTPGILRGLKRLNADYPFLITNAEHDRVVARLLRRPHGQDADELAKRVYRFAPDNVDQGSGSVDDLARSLERTGVLDLWWD